MNATLEARPTLKSSPSATQDSHLLWSSFPGEFRAQTNSLDKLPKLQFGHFNQADSNFELFHLHSPLLMEELKIGIGLVEMAEL